MANDYLRIVCASTVHFPGVPHIAYVQDLLRVLLLGILKE